MIYADLFDKKGLAPMLLGEVSEPFNSDDYIFELKLDGIRCLAYLDFLNKSTELRNKRDKDITEIYPELSLLHECTHKKCILDGELICAAPDGKPDFFAVQRRSLMTDRFKISLASKQQPCSFVAYDILYLDDKLVTDLPLTERKLLLNSNIQEKNQLFISRVIEQNGVAFYNVVKSNGLEGIVAKLKDSKYYFAKRSKEWVKIKVMQSEDLVVGGYVPGDLGHVKDLILAYYDYDGVLKERGRVGFGLSRRDNETIIKFAHNHRTNRHDGFRENGSEVWLIPQLVVEIQYMQKTENGGMRQPVFRGFIYDKPPESCIMQNPLA